MGKCVRESVIRVMASGVKVQIVRNNIQEKMAKHFVKKFSLSHLTFDCNSDTSQYFFSPHAIRIDFIININRVCMLIIISENSDM